MSRTDKRWRVVAIRHEPSSPVWRAVTDRVSRLRGAEAQAAFTYINFSRSFVAFPASSNRSAPLGHRLSHKMVSARLIWMKTMDTNVPYKLTCINLQSPRFIHAVMRSPWLPSSKQNWDFTIPALSKWSKQCYFFFKILTDREGKRNSSKVSDLSVNDKRSCLEQLGCGIDYLLLQ